MPELIAEGLRQCSSIRSVVNCLLDRVLQVSATGFGNIQLMNWKAGYLEIKAQRGFGDEFLNFFEHVELEDSSACARALRNRDSVVIEDIVADPQFSPCLDVMRRAGVRAVQSTPLVSSSGALVGILSTHFPMQHRPTDMQMRSMKEAGQLAANTIIRLRAGARTADSVLDVTDCPPNRRCDEFHERLLTSKRLLIESREVMVRAEMLLARSPWRL
ncbi:MAG TPA: GAF domain-containing protein [Xanthobacteraceae bacterium]|nr:GAF domain-containing protein [Xanthobacteraceae bacterium]